MLAAALLLGGCAAGRACAPPLQAGAGAEITSLQCAAAAGDKGAQLALGIRYEEGDGVPRDLNRAEQLYRRAARADRSGLYVYVPPAGGQRYGRVVKMGEPKSTPGLAEARIRFERLRAKRKAR